MGRVGARLARVQVSSRLTWTFSVRLETGPPPGSRRSVLPRPAPAVLRAVRPRLPRRHRRRHS
ncbi:hypothetical protein E5082_23655 [Streptomyces griseoluteus]|uniref:Uncharacterized protein n=1 Tax=Streptomyces griseoluteus TaxID=29306 RepID=A0A4Z1D8A2_STRGP|nr:hypothetical protein [Streptomyces griseoluteus]TGN78584.1 hypothetical protein E5082_23655 [Streptomyces griseoluteus]